MCEEWVKKGYKVTVLTGIPNYPEGDFYESYNWFKKRKENYRGIEIIRIPIIPRKSSSLFLILNYISFVISGFFWQLFTSVDPDLVFIFEVSPMTQALPGVWFSKRKKIPCHIYVQDLWPENVEIMTGLKNKNAIKVIGKMVDYIYHHCTNIFTTSQSFVKAIIQRGVNEEKVLYWPQYAEDFYFPLEKMNSGNKNSEAESSLNIIFTGNIGEAQGLDILIEAAEILKEKHGIEDINYTIVGNGRYKSILQKKVIENELNHLFLFIEKQSPESIPAILAQSDIAFLSLNNNPLFSKTIPAKLQSYMACGKPILASADGETKTIVKNANCGFVSRSGNASELVKSILKFYYMSENELEQYGTRSRDYYIENFNKQKLLEQMDFYFTL